MTVEGPIDKAIIMDFLRAGYNITPGALSFIKNKEDPELFARILLNSFNSTKQKTTITREMLVNMDRAFSNLIKDIPALKTSGGQASPTVPSDGEPTPVNASPTTKPAIPAPRPKTATELPETVQAKPTVLIEKIDPALKQDVTSVAPATVEMVVASVPQAPVAADALAPSFTSKSTFIPLAKEHAPQVKVIEDCTAHLKNDGDFADFLHLFNDRFEKLKAIFKARSDIARIVDIGDIASMARKTEEMYIVGMVVEKKQTKSGNTMLEIDDKTGSINVILSARNVDHAVLANIIHDEVLCFKGFYKDGIFIANEFFWPDARRTRRPQLAEEDLSILLISDLHIGSDNHLADLWSKFKTWIRGEGTSEKAREMAGKVKYIAIAGDLVDGVGVYPTQEEHLVIKDVYKQFEKAAEMLRDLPDYIKFIYAPGSHEPVRRALPQPSVPKSYAKCLYDMGVVMVSDPAVVETHGVKTMLFHGESFIDLSIDIPEISHTTPELAMQKLMMSRHLAPSFGKKTELAPDKKDWLVINEIPDILHTGHVHCNGVKNYHGTWLVNSGCFQDQTDFMKSLGIVPSPGKPNIVSLKDFKLTTLNLTA
nr:DNA-directed DNA polymerase II small subunit [Candidatus Sigynarchaeota archaeon]